ncbi:MAG: hypothetical protein SO072_07750 [Dysosmobacter sp.]|nr:hypothetical protein [Dysosmobacter sp.]
MAKIVEYINPITGAPEQVDQLDHTAQEIDDAVGRSLPGAAIDASIQSKPNPNLLDNWYFGNPANQRGQTEYNTMNYAIDRWRTWDSPASTWLKIVDGGVQIAYACYQFFEQYIYKALIGKKVTISILFADGKLFYKSFDVSKSAEAWYSVIVDYGGVSRVVLGVNPSNTADNGSNFFRIQSSTPGTLSDTILAIKLELGSQQTLAHQDESGNWVPNEIPDYGEQLARCQRYFRREKNNTTSRLAFGIGLPLSTAYLVMNKQIGRPMRAYPAVSVSAASDFLYCSSTLSSGVAATAVARGGVFVPNDIVAINLSGTFTVGTPYIVAVEPGGYMDFNAEI